MYILREISVEVAEISKLIHGISGDKSSISAEYLSNAEVENDDEERERMGILVQY